MPESIESRNRTGKLYARYEKTLNNLLNLIAQSEPSAELKDAAHKFRRANFNFWHNVRGGNPTDAAADWKFYQTLENTMTEGTEP